MIVRLPLGHVTGAEDGSFLGRLTRAQDEKTLGGSLNEALDGMLGRGKGGRVPPCRPLHEQDGDRD